MIKSLHLNLLIINLLTIPKLTSILNQRSNVERVKRPKLTTPITHSLNHFYMNMNYRKHNFTSVFTYQSLNRVVIQRAITLYFRLRADTGI